jgi:hypothetical protein
VKHSISDDVIECVRRNKAMTNIVPNVPASGVSEKNLKIPGAVTSKRLLHTIVAQQLVERLEVESTVAVWLQHSASLPLNQSAYNLLDSWHKNMDCLDPLS